MKFETEKKINSMKQRAALFVFLKINTIDKSIVRLTKKKERRHKLPFSGMNQEISTNPADIKRL